MLNCQVIINPDGTHSIDLGNGVVVNPNGTHSIKLENGIVVNPDGTHSIAINPDFGKEDIKDDTVLQSPKNESNRKAELTMIDLLKNNKITNKEFQILLDRLWKNDSLIDIFLNIAELYHMGVLSESKFTKIKKNIIELLELENQKANRSFGY